MGREVVSDLEMLNRLAKPARKDVVDIGCGGGALVRELLAAGADVVGVEISPEQLATAVARDPGTAARYLVGRAEDLPLRDASIDLAVFMRTLHHVPASRLIAALREARRAIRPDGAVYVAEPLAVGDYFELVSLVEDEVEARAAAQDALVDAAAAGLRRDTAVEYDVRLEIADLATLRTRIVSVDPGRARAFDARREQLEEAFHRLGEAGEETGERRFLQPMRADLLRPIEG